ncbi:hypothetical protein CVV68_03150 [Arthrobacter livingstonensis]|uniref:PknH-like extracellular domain-containing protein n=1 Tax=Arthrobacter livingstonensis TaxID=670078 RepID=A0A2V5LCN2_9MICC|nr:hypothetical protein [Arthrobacter livingstonensis]PYI69405.1 hypothetical protein CVV68_03150 [Arthrobacter livingstonensis]
MKIRFAPCGIVLAAALAAALTRCGNSGTAGTSPSTGPAGNAGTTSATPSASAVAKAYTNDDLAAMLTKLKDPKGRAFTVIAAAQIDQGLQVARQLPKTAVITPKACGVLATNNSQVPEGSTYAAANSISAADKTSITVTAFAVKDASSMARQLSASQKAASQCSSVTIAVAGKKTTTKVMPVPVTTSGDTSPGSLTSETAPTGRKITALTVTAIKGNLAATVVKTGTAITPAAGGELVKLVNTILANK